METEALKGGLAAKNKKKPQDFDQEQLKIGTKIEMEHTSDEALAQKIAMDHLTEHPDYYKELPKMEAKLESQKSAEKSEHDHNAIVEVTPSGIQEIVSGKESLKKEPKDKKLLERWDKIKKSLNNKTAFLDIAKEASSEDSEKQATFQTQQTEDLHPEQQEGLQPEHLSDLNNVIGPQDGKPGNEEIEQMLREEGHSDPEIAYIMYGHHYPDIDESDSAQASAIASKTQIDVENADKLAEIKRNATLRTADYEHEHNKRMADLEHENAKNKNIAQILSNEQQKRMMDLEYENAKKLKELELEYKKKELELKLQRHTN